LKQRISEDPNESRQRLVFLLGLVPLGFLIFLMFRVLETGALSTEYIANTGGQGGSNAIDVLNER
jgi:hypothetical protein